MRERERESPTTSKPGPILADVAGTWMENLRTDIDIERPKALVRSQTCRVLFFDISES